jgi:hypothetical protein
MLHRIRQHLGSPGLLVAIVALVAAVAGTAYAATKLNSTQKSEVKKIAKSFQGTGPEGPTGPTGPKGNAGAKGDAGANGKDGAPGAPGANGKGVATGTEATGTGNCGGLGGSWVEVEGSGTKKYACNGSPWTAGSLPSEAMETGVWRFVKNAAGDPFPYVPISFPIPLAAADAAGIQIEKFPKEAVFTANCPGNAEEPKAEPGFLCVYASKFESNFFGSPSGIYKLQPTGEDEGVNTAGALLYFEIAPLAADARSTGSFAITAP